MNPDEAMAQAQSGKLLPFYVLLGEERFQRSRVVDALRSAVTAGAVPGFNEDEFTAADASVDAVLAAARTLPMMATRRWVLVRDAERWEAKSDKADDSTPKAGVFDQLAAYAAKPSETTVLVLCADKLNGKRKLVSQAKKQGFVVDCSPLAKHALPGWVRQAALAKGNPITPSAAELVAEVAGPGMSTMDDLLERLSLFIGSGNEITEDAIGKLIPVVRPATVWQLVDALGRGDRGRALTLLEKVYDPSDRGLRLLGVLAWSTRQMLRFQAALAEGLAGPAAAKAAGVPPFRARELSQQVRRIPPRVLENWLVLLQEVDLALKGGSKRPPRAVLENALVDLCGLRAGS